LAQQAVEASRLPHQLTSQLLVDALTGSDLAPFLAQ